MARKHKGQALNDCPKDLNDIPYIRWMNQQIANGRHPKGLSAPPVLDGQGSNADDDDDDDPEQGLDTDDDEEEPEDAGMSPSDGDDEDEDAEDDAEEEAQPVSQPPKRRAARASGTNKGKGKAVPPPPRQEPRKKRGCTSREGLMDTAAAAPQAVDGGDATDVNVPADMEVPSSSQPGTSTPTFTAPPPPTTATPRRARVHETATMQAAMLVSATIKDCHGDAMTRIESLVREWMAQDMRLARERMTESAPPDVHRAPPDFSPPPPRGESTPPPEAAQHGDDVGDVNTVTLGAEDVEIWVRGADD
ncbi:unnamed protein product [Closterium sp. NIES-54]